MEHFIGIPIPQELRGQIADFCRVREYVSTEPHIKILSPSRLAGTPDLRERLADFCAARAGFRVVVAGPAMRPDRMLYLTVLPGAIGILEDRLARHLGLPPGGVYRPHVTVIRQYPGRRMDLERYLEEARGVFQALFSFQVGGLTLYGRSGESDPFLPMETLPFSGA